MENVVWSMEENRAQHLIKNIKNVIETDISQKCAKVYKLILSECPEGPNESRLFIN